MSELRMAVAQAAAVSCDLAANALTARRLLGAAKNLGAELVVFPELFLCGPDLDAIAAQPGRAVMSLSERPFGVVRGRCASLAVAAIVGGCLARGDGLVNVAIVVDGAGNIAAVYEKINLAPQERSLFVPGNQLVTCLSAGLRVGLAIGSDALVPEHTRALALAGAEAIACPAAFARGPDHHRYRLLFPTRALENTVYLAVANPVGAGYFGSSAVFDPAGYALATAGEAEDVVVADVDRAALESVRAEADWLEQRRPEVYRDRAERDAKTPAADADEPELATGVAPPGPSRPR